MNPVDPHASRGKSPSLSQQIKRCPKRSGTASAPGLRIEPVRLGNRLPTLKGTAMAHLHHLRKAGIWLVLLGAASRAEAAGPDLQPYQGAWLEQGVSCDDVYVPSGKGMAYKKPVNIFAPAFVISGDRLRTPQATCRIRSSRADGNRSTLTMDCANSVSTDAVKVVVSLSQDGSLRRYLNEQDSVGSMYRRCSR